jgi:chitinase
MSPHAIAGCLSGAIRAGALLLATLACSAAACSAAGLPPKAIVVYHDSWNEPPVTVATGSSLAGLPEYLNVVNLAFAKPDLVYGGDLDLRGTGLEYRYSGAVLRDSIALLKRRRPATRVLLSIGGAAYDNWSRFDEAAAARLVRDLGADGVDIDFEPAFPDCQRGPDQRIRCRTDAVWEALIRRTRAVLPRPFLLTASVWSVGAYGENQFRTAQPYSRYTGFMLSPLRSPWASEIDLLSINAYDAGESYDPLEAFRAYRAVWPGPLALGVEIRRAGGKGPFYSAAGAEALAREVAKDPNGAMMLYPLLAIPDGIGRSDSPDGAALAMALCRGMRSVGCDTLPP